MCNTTSPANSVLDATSQPGSSGIETSAIRVRREMINEASQVRNRAAEFIDIHGLRNTSQRMANAKNDASRRSTEDLSLGDLSTDEN